jgi:hypothetical protein
MLPTKSTISCSCLFFLSQHIDHLPLMLVCYFTLFCQICVRFTHDTIIVWRQDASIYCFHQTYEGVISGRCQDCSPLQCPDDLPSKIKQEAYEAHHSPPSMPVTHKLMYASLLTELSPSWGAINWAATQELPSISWHPKVQYRIHKSSRLVPILSHINPIHTIPSYLRSILILSTHLRLGLPRGIFPSGLHAPPISSLVRYIYIYFHHGALESESIPLPNMGMYA